MPIVDVLRIKIEKIDKYTHLPVEGDEAEKYIIECNTSAQLNPVYIGGNEIVYESDNSLVNYNVENFTLYGVNVVIQTATFNLKRHAFLTGGIFLDQNAIYPRKNMLGQDRYRSYANAQNTYDTYTSYSGMLITGQYHRRLWNLVNGVPEYNTNWNTASSTRTINGYISFTAYPENNIQYPTRESWVEINTNQWVPRFSNQGILSTNSGEIIPPWRDLVNGVTGTSPWGEVTVGSSAKDVIGSWQTGLIPETDNRRMEDQSFLICPASLWYQEKIWRSQEGLSSNGIWTIIGQGLRATYNNSGTIQSAIDTKYNIVFGFGWQNEMSYDGNYAVSTEDQITKQQFKEMITNNFKVVVSLNPNFQEHYKAYFSSTIEGGGVISQADFQQAIDTDEYLLDYFTPSSDTRLWQGYEDIAGTSAVVNAGLYSSNRLEYSFTYDDVVPVKLSVVLFADMDAITSSGYFNLPIAKGAVLASNNVWYDGRMIISELVRWARIEVAGQKNVSDVSFNYDWFNDSSEYEEELLQAGSEIPGVVPNTYYSPHSIAPNETDLFATTLYTRDFLGADVNQYYKLYMNNCFSDKQPGLTINQIFNDHEMHIYARDSFITVRPALEISPLTAEEYRQEIERDDST